MKASSILFNKITSTGRGAVVVLEVTLHSTAKTFLIYLKKSRCRDETEVYFCFQK